MSIKTTSLSEILNDTYDHDTHDHPAPRIFCFLLPLCFFFSNRLKSLGRLLYLCSMKTRETRNLQKIRTTRPHYETYTINQTIHLDYQHATAPRQDDAEPAESEVDGRLHGRRQPAGALDI